MIEFRYTVADQPDVVLNLRSPDLQDVEAVDLKTQLKRAIDSTLWSYISTPVSYQLRLEFSNIENVDEALTFINSAIGKTVQYTDYDSVVWTGKIIVDDEFEASFPSRNGGSFSIVFEGTRNA